MDKKILKAWGKGTIQIAGIDLDGCYVLEDGTAILSQRGTTKLIGKKWRSSRTESPIFIGAKNLQPFISDELKKRLNGIQFYDGSRLVMGYHADILPLICDVYLAARAANALTASQLPVAQMCEILVRVLSRMAMTSLIYEQLGYEKFKHPDALRILIESYLSDEIRKWAKEFPDELFVQMDRIYGNQRTTSQNRPQYYAKFIRKYIYEPIERGAVLRKLDEVIPKDSKGRKKSRIHSATSVEIGLPAVKAQIWQTLGVLKVSTNKRKFENNYNMLMGQGFQTDLFE